MSPPDATALRDAIWSLYADTTEHTTTSEHQERVRQVDAALRSAWLLVPVRAADPRATPDTLISVRGAATAGVPCVLAFTSSLALGRYQRESGPTAVTAESTIVRSGAQLLDDAIPALSKAAALAIDLGSDQPLLWPSDTLVDAVDIAESAERNRDPDPASEGGHNA